MGIAGQSQTARWVRSRVAALLVDDSGANAAAFAVYTLSDPRDIQDVRYVGQTASPRRRLLQHINQARLWLPDEVPWWIKSPKLRPLYQWIRELYRDGRRLPFMVVTRWYPDLLSARLAERELIHEYLSRQHVLFNVENEWLGQQLPLPLQNERR